MIIEVEADGKKIRFPVKSTGVLKEDYAKGYETSEGLIMSISDIQKMFSTVHTGNQKKLEYKTVLVKVSDITKVAEVEKTIRELGFTTSSMESIWEPMEKGVRKKQLMLGGLGAISLFVAALGITNTMIMSISERTREIGIMKSLGCFVKDIRVLFLEEVGAIGLLGGIVGGIISMIIAIVINFFSFEGPPALQNLAAAVIGGKILPVYVSCRHGCFWRLLCFQSLLVLVQDIILPIRQCRFPRWKLLNQTEILFWAMQYRNFKFYSRYESRRIIGLIYFKKLP